MNPEEQFNDLFGRPPVVRVQSPGRVNLIGEHVDYLGGCVMPVAIDRHITMLTAPSESPEVRVWSTLRSPKPAGISLDALERREKPDEMWLDYIIGVLAGYRERGVDLPGFDAALFSDLPSGSGLSSSAALETVTALTIEALTGVAQGTLTRALICQEAEHRFPGVPCGIMDQLAVGASRTGHAILIDCRDLTIKPVPIPPGAAIVVTDTGVRHALADGEYRRRREDCEAARKIIGVESLRDASLEEVVRRRESLGERLFRRARHAVTEMDRVNQFAIALEASDRDQILTLMRGSHASLRDDFEVSCDELDALVDAADAFGAERGLLGSRMTGGGFGGSTVSLVREDAAGALQSHLADAMEKEFGRRIEPFVSAASAGARILPGTD